MTGNWGTAAWRSAGRVRLETRCGRTGAAALHAPNAERGPRRSGSDNRRRTHPEVLPGFLRADRWPARRSRHARGRDQPLRRSRPAREQRMDRRPAPGETSSWHSSAFMARRETLQASGGYDLPGFGCASDTELILRLLEQGDRFAHRGYVGVLYRQVNGSVSQQFRTRGWLTWEGTAVYLLSMHRWQLRRPLSSRLRRRYVEQWQRRREASLASPEFAAALPPEVRDRLNDAVREAAPPRRRPSLARSARIDSSALSMRMVSMALQNFWRWARHQLAANLLDAATLWSCARRAFARCLGRSWVDLHNRNDRLGRLPDSAWGPADQLSLEPKLVLLQGGPFGGPSGAGSRPDGVARQTVRGAPGEPQGGARGVFHHWSPWARRGSSFAGDSRVDRRPGRGGLRMHRRRAGSHFGPAGRVAPLGPARAHAATAA